MRTIIFFTFLFAGLFISSYAQDSLPAKARIYKALISTNQTHNTLGYLAAISDSSLSISRTQVRLSAFDSDDIKHSKVYYNNIIQVKIRRKGSVGRGILIGGLIGLSAGIISGYAAGNDPPCTQQAPNPWDIFGFGQLSYGLCEASRSSAGDKAAWKGLAGAFGGAAVGALVGALVRKTFIIAGNKQKLHYMRSKLLH
jgi:hypothetical protein